MRPASSERGFSLIEMVVATGILAAGLLSLVGILVLGLNHLKSSSPSLIAREKAREAVESVHAARDTRVITWAQIKNVSAGGVFVDGDQPMNKPGADGLVNTADDATQGLEEQISAGVDGVLGTGDDVHTPLRDFTRKIEITNLLDAQGAVNPDLRQIRVAVRYKVGSNWRTYTLTTYISSYS
jgi:uncharacterized protein (TIGR02598 family)